jgi:CubicO group peptidase (beta-lactamase class C family)
LRLKPVKRLKAAIAVFLIILQSACAYESRRSGSPGDWRAQVDAIARGALRNQHLAGLSIAIARNGQILYARGYGYRNIAKRQPATPSTIYNIASITKQFTAACVMLLQQDGKLNVDDPIAKFLPGFPHGEQITIRELLNHTSGLADYLDILRPSELSIPRILAAVEKAPLRFKPGTRYEYSNTNYVLAGVIVAKAAGMRFDEFLTKRIIEPSGLHSTSIGTTPIDLPHGAPGYTVINGKTVLTAPQGVGVLDYPDGGVNTTVLDLTKWDEALDSGRVVNKKLLAMMMTPGPHGHETTYRYGFGLSIDSAFGHREISHQGEWTGYSGENVTFPDDGIAIVLLSNTDGFNEEYIAREIFALVEHPSSSQVAIEQSSVPGENPKNTHVAAEVLAQLSTGTLDGSLIAPQFRKQLTPSAIAVLHRQLDGYGPPRRMIFVGRDSRTEAVSEVYRIFYPTAVVSYWISFDRMGKVAGLSFSRED